MYISVFVFVLVHLLLYLRIWIIEYVRICASAKCFRLLICDRVCAVYVGVCPCVSFFLSLSVPSSVFSSLFRCFSVSACLSARLCAHASNKYKAPACVNNSLRVGRHQRAKNEASHEVCTFADQVAVADIDLSPLGFRIAFSLSSVVCPSLGAVSRESAVPGSTFSRLPNVPIVAFVQACPVFWMCRTCSPLP